MTKRPLRAIALSGLSHCSHLTLNQRPKMVGGNGVRWRNARAERVGGMKKRPPLAMIARTLDIAIILSLGFTKSWEQPSFLPSPERIPTYLNYLNFRFWIRGDLENNQHPIQPVHKSSIPNLKSKI